MPNIIHLPDGRAMVHAGLHEVVREVDAAFEVGPHVPIDAAAPRRNICARARKDYESNLTREHEAVLPGDTHRPAAPEAAEPADHPEVG